MDTDANQTRKLALIGAALMIVGTFLPVVSLPFMGSMTYIQGDGIFIVILGLVSGALALFGKTRHALWSGLLALVIMLYTIMTFQSRMNDAKAKLDTELADNPFRGLADMAVNSVSLQWGWIVLIGGAGLVIYAGYQARNHAS